VSIIPSYLKYRRDKQQQRDYLEAKLISVRASNKRSNSCNSSSSNSSNNNKNNNKYVRSGTSTSNSSNNSKQNAQTNSKSINANGKGVHRTQQLHEAETVAFITEKTAQVSYLPFKCHSLYYLIIK
jgi:hypothetical protein